MIDTDFCGRVWFMTDQFGHGDMDSLLIHAEDGNKLCSGCMPPFIDMN